MFDLVPQCTLNGNHTLQMHLHHGKDDNWGQWRTLSCVHPVVCSGFLTTSSKQQLKRVLLCIPGASGVKIPLKGVNVQATRKSSPSSEFRTIQYMGRVLFAWCSSREAQVVMSSSFVSSHFISPSIAASLYRWDFKEECNSVVLYVLA